MTKPHENAWGASRTKLAHMRVAATDVLYAAERNGADRAGRGALTVGTWHERAPSC